MPCRTERARRNADGVDVARKIRLLMLWAPSERMHSSTYGDSPYARTAKEWDAGADASMDPVIDHHVLVMSEKRSRPGKRGAVFGHHQSRQQRLLEPGAGGAGQGFAEFDAAGVARAARL